MDLPVWLTTLDPLWMHALIFVLLLVEGIGVPGIPFELVWLGEGLLIHAGKTTLIEAIAWGTLGNLLGNIIGYVLGERVMRYIPARYRSKMGIAEVRTWLSRWGGLVVIISRWFGLIRTPFILYAGVAGMPLPWYAFYSFWGALSWVGIWQYGLYLFGELFIRMWHQYQPYVIGVGVLIAILSLLSVLRKPTSPETETLNQNQNTHSDQDSISM